MILPSKYMDLDTSVLSVAGEILNELKQSSAVPLRDLDGIVRSNLGEDARFNFIPALNLLFLVERLDYDPDADAVVSLAPGNMPEQ